MAGDSAIHILRKADLRYGTKPAEWDDPEAIAVVHPPRRATMLDNPLSRSEDDPMQLIGTFKGRVVGRMDVIPGEINVAGAAVPMLWASNLSVPPEHRHTLMGVKLIMQMHRLCPTIAVCGVSQVVKPIYEKLGWANIPLPRHVLLRRSRAVVERYVSNRLAAGAARVAADLALATHRGASAIVYAIGSRRLGVREIDHMTGELHTSLDYGDRPLSAHRSPSFTDWLRYHAFGDDPRNRSGLFVIEAGDGTPLAVFLAKVRFHPVATQRAFKNLLLASLQDWAIVLGSPLTFADVVRAATRVAGQWQADAMEVCVPPDCDGAFLRRRGFLRSGELSVMVKASPGSPLLALPYKDPAAWRVRPAEGDNFFA